VAVDGDNGWSLVTRASMVRTAVILPAMTRLTRLRLISWIDVSGGSVCEGTKLARNRGRGSCVLCGVEPRRRWMVERLMVMMR
jgi:hypothetical protein